MDNMCIVKVMEQFNSGNFFKKLQKYFLYCPHWSDSKWKKSIAGGGENKKKMPGTVLILQEQLYISELFKDIQAAIPLILLYRTM